ncbi:uncharacterized protein LOC134214678 [Armigeres subalbatus]|uniref:uncharacterized protein LOC134214678 n=1 Tax=Armigeres subalbatus TaxID=124917 RepID=UPI002ED24D19
MMSGEVIDSIYRLGTTFHQLHNDNTDPASETTSTTTATGQNIIVRTFPGESRKLKFPPREICGCRVVRRPPLLFCARERLRCYACSVTANSGDNRCITDPASVEGQSVVTCNRKYCTIQRQEMMDPPDKVNTFLRGCEENPLFLNDVLEDSTFRTYYRSCSSDLCNSGDGLQTASGLSGLDAGASENLLVPGLLGSASTTIRGSGFLVPSFLISMIAALHGTAIV